MSLVLDASLTVAWLLDDEFGTAAGRIMARVARDEAHVPSLWRLEVANALRNVVRRGRCTLDLADGSLERLSRLPILIDAETDAHAWGRTRALSTEEDLTLYDAAYLELALRLDRPLASNDGDLIAAARRRGVEVLLV